MRTTRYTVCALTVSLLLLTTGGCKGLLRSPDRPAPPARLPRPIAEVSVDRDLVAMGTVSVDITAATEVERVEYKLKSIDRYWQPRDRLRTRREALTRAMEFVVGSDLTQVLDRDDPLWNKWEGKQFLIVIAYIPGVEDDTRRMLVLDREETGAKTVRIRATKDGLEQVK